MGRSFLLLNALWALAVSSLAQQPTGSPDSLMGVWADASLPDSARLKAATALSGRYLRIKPDSSLHYAEAGLAYPASSITPQRMAALMAMKGEALGNMNRYDEALEWLGKAIRLYEEGGFQRDRLAGAYVTIGNVYQTRGDHPRAMDYMTRAMRMNEELGNIAGVGVGYANIGNMLWTQGDVDGAFDNYTKSIKIFLQDSVTHRKYVGLLLMNIGNIHHHREELDRAEDNYTRSLAISRETGDLFNQAANLANLGNIALSRSHYEKALDCLNRSVELYEQAGSKKGKAQSLSTIGRVYRKMGRMREALRYGEESMALAWHGGSVNRLRLISEELVNTYEAVGNWRMAHETYLINVRMSDSIFSMDNQREVMAQQMRFEFDKKEALAQAEQDKRDALAAEEMRRRGQQRNALMAGVALSLALAGMSLRGYRMKQRASAIIAQQKKLVDTRRAELEARNRDILDSITYARRLQQAVLPPAKVVRDFFTDSFLLYLPRDIVSGDFYWMESLSPATGESQVSYFAVGDCTGHGVPGAMLSVMGLNSLNRALNELGITSPDRILDQVSADFLTAFERSDLQVRDGMDIGICALDAQSRVVRFAGANIALHICRGGEMLILRPDRRSVGFHEAPHGSFGLQELQLQEGDTVFLFTDGYADQFGGGSDTKFKAARLRQLLLSLEGKPMTTQREVLLDTFEQWRGTMEQTDDLCMMAVRV